MNPFTPASDQPELQQGTYDFRRCKLCGSATASPKYPLKTTTVYACSACDFHFINHLDDLPPAAPGENRQLLDNQAESFIAARLPANEKQHLKNLLLVKRRCALAGMQCLDIGAGAGLFTRLLADADATAHGIEPQAVFRAFARERFGIELRAETVDAGYWQQGYANFFDVVTLWDVFEHVNFPAELLQHAYNLIKPGGLLFLDTPRRDALYYRISEWSYRLSAGTNPLFLASVYSALPFRHKQLFTQRQLLQLVERVGFSVLSLNSSRFRTQTKLVLVCCKPKQPPP